MEKLLENVQEIITREELLELIKGPFKFYYGTAPTGPFHIAYFSPLTKFVELVRAGGKGIVLIADWHAYLDDRKTPWEEMEIRSNYYKMSIEALLEQFIDLDDVKFVFGHEFQKTPEYMEDLIRASGLVTVKRAMRSASEVVRIKDNPHVSELIYPIMQCLDVKHLGVDFAIGGIDQRHIYALAREILPELGYKPGVYLFTPILTALTGAEDKMSASKPQTTITIHDSDEIIMQKLRKAFCPPSAENNPLLNLLKYIIFPLFNEVKITNEKTGEEMVYTNYAELENDYISKKIHPLDLKISLAGYVIKLISPIRDKVMKSGIYEEAIASLRRQGYNIDA